MHWEIEIALGICILLKVSEKDYLVLLSDTTNFNLDPFIRYSFQNRFLNKEVLELNQLRTQAVDREQKLFIEASDWEAKFYQIQSKYLLLLNELHNPQASQTS